MIRPVIKAVDSGTATYDKTAGDLQSNIAVKRDKITGTLKHVEGFEAFGDGENDGNFLALELKADEGVEIKTILLNGTHGEVTVDDGFCVYRITDKEKQKIKITYAKGTETVTKVYTLKELNLEEG